MTVLSLQYVPEFDGHRLLSCERDRHVGDEAANVMCQIPVGCVAIQQGVGLGQVGLTDGRLTVLELAAPWRRGQGLRRQCLA